jgi:hypothetical protein
VGHERLAEEMSEQVLDALACGKAKGKIKVGFAKR